LGDANSIAVAVVLVGLSVIVALAFARTRGLTRGATDAPRRDEPEVASAHAEALRIAEEARRAAEALAERSRSELEAMRAELEEEKRLSDEHRRKAEDARRDAEAARKEASVEAKAAALEATEAAKDEARRQALDLERAALLREERVEKREQLVLQKEQLLTQRELELTRREVELRGEAAKVDDLHREAAKLASDQRARLEALAGLSGEEARRSLVEQFRDEAKRDFAREAKAIEEAAREEADKRAKRIIGLAIQRYAGEHVQERAVTSIHLPNDDLKGRIIGREGRNIRALQEACGVDFIVDDTPETIVVSGFDPIRREVARLALERLIADGRIHPTRIEDAVQKAQADVERSVQEAAEQSLLELGVTRVHPEIARLLGRLKYRYSYAQNVLKHSVECGFLCGMMAAELGQNEKLARRAALLHDIGKAVSHEQEGGHAMIGGQYARKYGEDPIVANGIACHHDDEPAMSVIGHLVTAADALSGARPGARREMLESYVKRLHELEAISSRFAGVEKSYAIQAGREVRVIVEPSEVTDAEAALLAREISKRIEDELTYPGQIRVTVIRETRAVDYAK
jgi:ribonuclease Y